MLNKGFTLIEILVVMAIIVITALSGFALGNNLIIQTSFENQTAQIVDVIKLTQTRSISRYKDSKWGVYFYLNPAGNDSYTLFKGNTYAERDISYDLASSLPGTVLLTSVNLNGGSEITFEKNSGQTNQNGIIQMSSTNGDTVTISINTLGSIEKTPYGL